MLKIQFDVASKTFNVITETLMSKKLGFWMRILLKKMWRRWKAGVHKINDGLAFVLMSLTYILAVTPVAIGFRIRGTDLLDRGLPKRKSFWLEKKEEEMSISRVQRPY